MNLREYFSDFRDGLAVRHSLYTPLLAASVYLLVSLSGPIYRLISPSGTNIYLVVSVIELLAIAVPCMLFLRLRGGGERDAMALHGVGSDSFVFVLLATLAMLSGSIALSAAGAQMGMITSSGYTLYESYGLPSGGASNTALTILTFALIPALCEEFLCRGIIMSEYSRDGIAASLIISSLFFAMLHFSLGKFFIFFFCGLMLGFIRLLSHSLLASFLAHFIYNLFGVFAQGFFSRITEQLSEFLLIFFIGIGSFLLLMFFVFGEADRICHRYARSGAPLPQGAYDGEIDEAGGEADGANPVVRKLRKITRGAKVILFDVIAPTFILCVIMYIIISLIV